MTINKMVDLAKVFQEMSFETYVCGNIIHDRRVGICPIGEYNSSLTWLRYIVDDVISDKFDT